MEISFATSKLAKLCNSEKRLRGAYGPRMAAVIRRRLMDLDAAETLASMKELPGRCHQLTENLDGLFAIDLVHPNRLVFVPDHDPVPELRGGGVDWSKVTKIEVAGIGDYH
ncbi:MAG: type II toxin-antitoxin system RelE/ParE family toxin [Planctomycetota bacterium]|jgi:proteic killer suppression protein